MIRNISPGQALLYLHCNLVLQRTLHWNPVFVDDSHSVNSRITLHYQLDCYTLALLFPYLNILEELVHSLLGHVGGVVTGPLLTANVNLCQTLQMRKVLSVVCSYIIIITHPAANNTPNLLNKSLKTLFRAELSNRTC